MHAQETAARLLDILHAEPDNLEIQGVYLDFLEDHGDPRVPVLRNELSMMEVFGGRNVHGLFSAQRFFGPFPPQLLQTLARQRIPDVLLRACVKTHFIALYPGASLREAWRCGLQQNAADPETKRQRSYCHALHQPPEQHSLHGAPSYLLVPKAIPRIFTGCSKTRQIERLAMIEEFSIPHRTATAAEISCAALLRFQDTRERLFSHYFVRCADDAIAAGPAVGCFTESGLQYAVLPDQLAEQWISLAITCMYPADR